MKQSEKEIRRNGDLFQRVFEIKSTDNNPK